MDLSLTDRRQRLRCALCHDALPARRVRCSGCGTCLHKRCAAALSRCPTLGCQSALPPGAGVALLRRGSQLPLPLSAALAFAYSFAVWMMALPAGLVLTLGGQLHVGLPLLAVSALAAGHTLKATQDG